MLPAESTRVMASREDRNNCPTPRFHSSAAFFCSSEAREPDAAGLSETGDALLWESGSMAGQINYTGALSLAVPTKLPSDCSLSIFHPIPSRLQSELHGRRSVTVRFFWISW